MRFASHPYRNARYSSWPRRDERPFPETDYSIAREGLGLVLFKNAEVGILGRYEGEVWSNLAYRISQSTVSVG